MVLFRFSASFFVRLQIVILCGLSFHVLGQQQFYVGADKGLGLIELDTKSKTLKKVYEDSSIARANFFAYHPTLNLLYVLHKQGKKNRISIYEIRENGHLGFVSGLHIEVGPCHIAAHPDGRSLAIAHYRGGGVSSITLDKLGHFTSDPLFIAHDTYPASKVRC